jgi:chemotaxis protein MotB
MKLKENIKISGEDVREGLNAIISNLIVKQLSELNNKIVVEGHTDAKPYPPNPKGYNNFDLSTDRANTARRILEQAGISDKQIDEVRGYADHRLRDPLKPYDKINRRISILVKFEQLTSI